MQTTEDWQLEKYDHRKCPKYYIFSHHKCEPSKKVEGKCKRCSRKLGLIEAPGKVVRIYCVKCLKNDMDWGRYSQTDRSPLLFRLWQLKNDLKRIFIKK